MPFYRVLNLSDGCFSNVYYSYEPTSSVNPLPLEEKLGSRMAATVQNVELSLHWHQVNYFRMVSTLKNAERILLRSLAISSRNLRRFALTLDTECDDYSGAQYNAHQRRSSGLGSFQTGHTMMEVVRRFPAESHAERNGLDIVARSYGYDWWREFQVVFVARDQDLTATVSHAFKYVRNLLTLCRNSDLTLMPSLDSGSI